MAEPPDIETLARRCLDLWEDQVGALAADSQTTEQIARLFRLMAAAAGAAADSAGRGEARGNGRGDAQRDVSGEASEGVGAEAGRAKGAGRADASGSDASGPAASATASGPGRDAFADLLRRLDALEERIARLEEAGGGAGPRRAAGRSPRKRRS